MIIRQYIGKSYLISDFVDISAPIIPLSETIGNLKLDTHIVDIRDWVLEGCNSNFPSRKILHPKIFSGLQVDYIYKNGELTFTVDICTGKIIMISCQKGYLGKLNENIYIGNSWYQIPNRIELFDSYDGYSLLSSLPELRGFFITVPEHLADGYDDLNDLPDFTIEEMGIFSRYVDGIDLYEFYYGDF